MTDRPSEREHRRSRSRSRSRRRSRSRDRERDRQRGHRSRSRDRDRRRSPSDSRRARRRSRSTSRSRSRDRGRDRHAEPRDKRSRWSPESLDRDRDTRDRRDSRDDVLPPPPPMHRNIEPPLSDTPPAVASIHHGTVHTIKPFGLFIAIPGYRRHVLVHHTQVDASVRFEKDDDNDIRVKALDYLFPKGQAVWVKVVSVEPDERSGELRVNGSMKAVSQEDGTDLDPAGKMTAATGPLREDPPQEGSVHQAVVKRIEAYGVFVALDGFKKHGLVHSSQVSNYLSFSKEDSDEEKKAEMAGVVSIGERVFVKVVEVGEDDGSGRGPKIGCSIKLVDQKTGEDMDPMGTRYKPRGEAGASGRHGSAALGASAGAVVGGKIDWGHLAGDNRLYVGDHKGEYKLLDEALPPPPPIPQHLPPPPAGRGQGMVQPAWMTGGAGAAPAPGSGAATADAGPQAPRTVEEALAIIEQFSKQKKSRSKDKDKKKKKSKSKKHKQEKKKKHKKESKESRGRHESSSSSSSSGSEDDR